MTEAILISAAAAVVVGISWRVMASRKTKARRPAYDVLPTDGGTASKPLLTESELSFYNLLQIAVQDYYLIFAQVPLWAFISLDSTGKDRIRLVKHMALKRADFALMHPGSRRVAQVVQIEEEFPTADQKEHQRIIEAVVVSANIRLVKVQSKKSYAIPELVALLGLTVEE